MGKKSQIILYLKITINVHLIENIQKQNSERKNPYRTRSACINSKYRHNHNCIKFMCAKF